MDNTVFSSLNVTFPSNLAPLESVTSTSIFTLDPINPLTFETVTVLDDIVLFKDNWDVEVAFWKLVPPTVAIKVYIVGLRKLVEFTVICAIPLLTLALPSCVNPILNVTVKFETSLVVEVTFALIVIGYPTVPVDGYAVIFVKYLKLFDTIFVLCPLDTASSP